MTGFHMLIIPYFFNMEDITYLILGSARSRSPRDFPSFLNWIEIKGPVVVISTDSPFTCLFKNHKIFDCVHFHCRYNGRKLSKLKLFKLKKQQYWSDKGCTVVNRVCPVFYVKLPETGFKKFILLLGGTFLLILSILQSYWIKVFF